MKHLMKALLAVALCLMLYTAGMAEGTDIQLLAHYTFDDSADLGADASGNGNDLVTFVNPDGIHAEEGYRGGAVHFDGTSGMYAAGESAADFMDGYTGSLTVSFFAKVDLDNARNGNARVVDHGINGSDKGFTTLVNVNRNADGSNTVYSISKMGKSDWWSSYAALDGDPASWHHYTMVFDAERGIVSAFIDGVLKCEVSAFADETAASDFSFGIGGSWNQYDWFNAGNREVTLEGFTGCVDDVKVFAGAVYDMAVIGNDIVPPVSLDPVADYSVYRINGETITEVTTEYVDEVETDLRAYYDFNDAENLGADVSGNGNDLVNSYNPDGITSAESVNGTNAVHFGGDSVLYIGGNAWEDFADEIEGAMTISFHVKADAPVYNTDDVTNGRVVDNGINGSNNGFTTIVWAQQADNYIAFKTLGVSGTDFWAGYGDAPGLEAMGDWHHYVMVYDPDQGTMKTFIDGNLKANVALTGNEVLSSDFAFSVGGNYAPYDWFNGNVQGFQGAVEDVKVFAEAIYDMDVIDQAGMGGKEITHEKEIFIQYDNIGYINNTVCVLGPAFRDFKDPITDKWYTFMPIDLTESGAVTYALVGGNAYIIGDVTVVVDGDQLTANYRYYNTAIYHYPTEDLGQYLNFFGSYDEVTADMLDPNGESAFEFGKTYSIANDLGGAETALLYVCNRASFWTENTTISRYIAWNHQAAVDAMVDALGLTEQYTK
ncbi:MAG: LamG domain-containing protein [Clostridiales bacterium]|nr:LamG domain-containing protein [Clostridiales bacterium]